AHAPRRIVLLLTHVEAVERAVRIDAQRVLREDRLLLLDRQFDLLGRFIELGENLPLDELVRLETGGHLEGLDARRQIAETVAVNEAEVVPEIVLEVGVAFAGDAVEHLSERALELLPVLLLREDLVDALEGLEEKRIEVEGLVEALH